MTSFLLCGPSWNILRNGQINYQSVHSPIFNVCVVSCRCPMLSNVSRSSCCSYCDGRLKAGFVALSLSLPAFQTRKLLLLDLLYLIIRYYFIIRSSGPMLSNAPSFHMSETDVSRSPWCSYCDGRLKAGFVAMSLSLPAFQMRKLLLLDLYILLLDIISLSDLLNKTQGLVWISRKKNKQEVHIWKP